MKKIFALILALSLTLALVACGGGGGPAQQLKGTWTGELFGVELKMTFTGDEVTMDMTAFGENESETAKYTVDSSNKLTLSAEGTEDTVIEYGEKAKEGDENYWFIDGKTLYISGMELTKG